jgi:acetyl esterase/lipase
MDARHARLGVVERDEPRPPSLPAVARDALRGGRAHRYGPHRSQRAELHLPPGPGPHPVVIAVHGGSWRRPIGRVVMRPACRDLVRRGVAVWNVGYRRVGEGGGWPQTFEDVAAAIDALADAAAPLDLGRVALLGHSAGGHLALWAAGRPGLPAGAPGAGPRLAPRAVLGLAAVSDLERWPRLVRPGGIVHDLMGATPAEAPERYALANPIRRVPPGVPVVLVHSRADEQVPLAASEAYRDAVLEAGGAAEVRVTTGAHNAHIDPRADAWRTAARAVVEVLDAPLRETTDAARLAGP